ncbi:geranylgeranylglyceryl/heptaprenylglyceryl phosphate synthase [candidate division KSB1 bacterium]|nr:geranylgeranylglyceryl/heptaprenylglyceryl phosphate synthase [candidate division KSB1 bacterium]
MNTLDTLLEIREKKGAGYIVLIDPDKQSVEQSIAIAQQAEKEGADVIFIGGSLLLFSVFDDFVTQIKSHVSIPVVIFPGGTNQISQHADAILFMSIISSRNPDVLMGKQILAAPVIKMLGLEAISTAYMLIESGKMTSAEFMSDTRPIPRDKYDIAVAHALAAEYMGMKLIYLEAGSGAIHTVPNEMIHQVTNYVSIPVIVGGGITSPELAREKVAAGASFIVTGNVLENKLEQGRIRQFAMAVHHKIET